MRTLGLAAALMACAVLVLAVSAQAAPVAVLNASFEDPVVVNNTGGTITSWTSGPQGGMAGTDSRFMTNAPFAAPTDGDQILALGDRRPWGWLGNTVVSQVIGKAGILSAIGSELEFRFDARAGMGWDWGGGADGAMFYGYFTVGGAQAGTIVSETVGTIYGTSRTLPTWADLALAGAGPRPDTSPGFPRTRSDYMAQYMATLSLIGVDPNADIGIAFQYTMPTPFPAWTGENRLAVDNVRVDATPEPATLALLGLGGIAMLIRRKR